MSLHAVVIGSGTDSLVVAHVLARAGLQVLVIEERPASAADSGCVLPRIREALGLDLKVHAPDPWVTAMVPDGRRLELRRDVARTAQSIKAFSARDAERWPEFCRRMAALARLLERIYAEAPTDPLNLRFALRVRRLGREGMVDLMRLLPMSVAELLDDWFECDALKGALGAMGIVHVQQGPRSGGTAFGFLHHHVGSPPGVFRPSRSNVNELLRQRPGVDFRTARVAKIDVRNGRAAGVVLENGEEIAASIIVSGLDPRRTLLELADPGWLDPELARAITHIRCRGVAARLVFASAPEAENVVVAPSLDYLERAYDEVKHGRVSQAPYLETRAGSNGTEVHFQYVPYEAQADLVKTARRLLPGLASAPATVLAPSDLEHEHGWPRGQPYHAELALDQALWMRPLPELAQYATPIDGLWLCGPAMHPGGGICGAAGYNCANAILKTRGKGR